MKLNDLPSKGLNKVNTPMIRIEWRINQQSGAGEWFDASERNMLESWVKDANSRYGAGTHNIATAPT